MEAYLKFNSVSKDFPGVRALDGISFDVKEGSVHGLVGENGAGKSTLLKILSGAYVPTSGNIIIGDKKQLFKNTKEAINAGVAAIYQELNLVPEMTVAENLLLGNYPTKFGFVNKKKMIETSLKILETIGENIEPLVKLKSLSIGQRQMIEIAKALLQDAKIIVFDEPTSSLSDREVRRLFAVVKDLKNKGRTIIYVSHRLEEVFEICDSVTVFRDGKLVHNFETMKDVTRDLLVKNMVGRSITDIYNYKPRKTGEPVLEVENIMGPGLQQPASFSVAAGEIVGFFGLIGAGRTELMKLVYGSTPKKSGRIKIFGKETVIREISDSIKSGLTYCPEDRKQEGIIPIRSVLENINISVRRLFSSFGFIINNKKEIDNTIKFIKKLNIKTPRLSQLAMNLSGGNQQKVILARWLSENIKVILMDEPTRGIDVGAKTEIYSIIFSLAEEGFGVVVVSSELPEILGICDRIIVMKEGKIVGSLNRNEATQEKLLQLALPLSETEEK